MHPGGAALAGERLADVAELVATQQHAGDCGHLDADVGVFDEVVLDDEVLHVAGAERDGQHVIRRVGLTGQGRGVERQKFIGFIGRQFGRHVRVGG